MVSDFKLDMSMMFAVHDALRRDLARLAQIAAQEHGEPGGILRTAVGWEMLKTFLRIHHSSEDAAVWAVIEDALPEHAEGRAVLEMMEAEHAAIDPLLDAVDAAVASPGSGRTTLLDAVDALTSRLRHHLEHEETQGLALVDATLTKEQWKVFSDDHRARVGANANRYLPWLLDDASPAAVSRVLEKMPEPLRAAYETEWRAAYQDLRPWSDLANATS